MTKPKWIENFMKQSIHQFTPNAYDILCQLLTFWSREIFFDGVVYNHFGEFPFDKPIQILTELVRIMGFESQSKDARVHLTPSASVC